MVRNILKALFVAILLLAVPSAARAELVEEIIAWVNGDIITRTEYEMQLQAQTADAYQRLAGDEQGTRLLDEACAAFAEMAKKHPDKKDDSQFGIDQLKWFESKITR